MSKWLLPVAFAVVLSAPCQMKAQQLKLSDLSEFCSSSDSGAQMACRFYIFGAMEGLHIGAAATASNHSHFCVPEGVSISDIDQKVKTLMKQDLDLFPKDRDMPAVSFIAAVIEKAYPCKR
jgi:hypothetical protein